MNEKNKQNIANIISHKYIMYALISKRNYYYKSCNVRNSYCLLAVFLRNLVDNRYNFGIIHVFFKVNVFNYRNRCVYM